jgi:hypothetical protein
MELHSDAGIGIYKIRKDIHHRVWDEFLAFDADLASKVRGFASQREFLANPDMELAINLGYATAIAWGVYALNQAVLPDDENDHQALAHCWHQYFCSDPRQQPEHFVQVYAALRPKANAVAAA